MNNNARKRLIIVILILFFLLLLFMTMLLGALENDTSSAANSTVNSNIVDGTQTGSLKPKTLEQIIAEYKSQYLSRSGNEVYIKLGKDLYDENGNSNEKFFEAFIYDLGEIFLTSNFVLINKEKTR